MNLKFPVLLLTLKLSLVLSSSIIQNGGNFLYKCRSSNLKQEYFDLPVDLQGTDYTQQKLEYLAHHWNTSKNLFNFTLKHGEPNCLSGTFDLKIPLFLDENQDPTFNFTPDGYLAYIKARPEGNQSVQLEEGEEINEEDLIIERIYYHQENYCISSLTENFVQVKACKSQCYFEPHEKGEGLCIQKCSPMGFILSDGDTLAKTTGPDWLRPRVTDPDNNLVPSIYPQFQLNSFDLHWTCPPDLPDIILNYYHEDNLRTLLNGQVQHQQPPKKFWNPIYADQTGSGSNSRQYCGDGYWNEEKEGAYSEKSRSVIMKCISNEKERQRQLEVAIKVRKAELNNALGIGMKSGAFLIHLIPVIVYLILWDKQNVHGFTIFTLACVNLIQSLIVSLHFGFFTFGNTTQVIEAFSGYLRPLCISIGIVDHFLFLSCFAWTSVLSYDVWSKIRSMTPRSLLASKGRKRFLLYCAFGFGLPVVMTLIGIIVEFGPSDTANVIRPGYSNRLKSSCTMGMWGHLVYITSIIISLYIVNMIFVVLSIKIIWESKKRIGSFGEGDASTISIFSQNASLIIKLFVTMGLCLIIQVVRSLTDMSEMNTTLIIILNGDHILYALGFVWVTVWNKKVRFQLIEKFSLGGAKSRKFTSGVESGVVISAKETTSTTLRTRD